MVLLFNGLLLAWALVEPVGNRTSAIVVNVAGFVSPYVLTLTLRAIGYRALSEQTDPADLFKALAVAVNSANLAVKVATTRIGS